jgi:hypothetical protein
VSTYISVRGWLECDEQQLAGVRAVIREADEGFYSGGWGFPARHINWTHYVFYGADIRAGEAPWLLEQLRRIARIPATDADGDLVTGLFLATHEVDGMSEWQVRDGDVFITPASGAHRYLDA